MAERPEFGGSGGGNIIIVKRIVKGEHGHHGGAWKVAYADFVTAMMAFFLLLWLLNAVTEEQLNGISDYFTPISASNSQSGAGGLLGGLTIGEGAQESQTGAVTVTPLPPPTVGQGGQDLTDAGEGAGDPTAEDIEDAMRAREEAQFEQAADELEKLIQGIPELSELADSLLIDNTPEGLRIQIVDQDGLPLFPSGSAAMFGYTREIMGLVARVINKLPNELSISGHTDATPFTDPSGYSNWELSADRALATRRTLEDFGVTEKRVAKVTGQAANEPLMEDDPGAPQNRRISIVLLRGDGSTAAAFDRLPDFLEPTAPR
ncbi:MAG: flagellar motor protein MotB [Rhodospirillaceae bacterium]|jgi:chemotaxis protein MotB|nr:flagellar motor protein MotB [Rhodospirillaceae bacterium]MBT5567165.1 flagellar motor protein MotB [Rhodospirillaceae bacterium]MBT6089378.1 flagellar motor protein MotB [Rhodospirillaceae bacterium]